jgi:hypothetical protein
MAIYLGAVHDGAPSNKMMKIYSPPTEGMVRQLTDQGWVASRENFPSVEPTPSVK